MPDDILDLIDAAVADWETGPDAVRYNGPAVHARRAPRPATRLMPVTAGNLIASRPMLIVGDGPAVLLHHLEVVSRPLVDHFAGMQEQFRLLGEFMAGFSMSMNMAAQKMAGLARALGMELRHGTFAAPPCACHPAPFPAARDYRRRTKHRNRRRR